MVNAEEDDEGGDEAFPTPELPTPPEFDPEKDPMDIVEPMPDPIPEIR